MAGPVGCSGAVTTTEDQRRAAAIAAYGVLDGLPREGLSALAGLAAQLAGVPRATVSLVTGGEQWQVAAVDAPPAGPVAVDPFCRAVVDSGLPVRVEDARRDPRFADDAQAGGPDPVRCYAGHPLVTPEGVTIGALSVRHEEAHPLPPEVVEGLGVLAGLVVDALELGLTSRRLGEAEQRLRGSDRRLSVFAGQVGHDLKNPLAAVRMCLELVQDDVDPDSDVAALVERAAGGVLRMNALLDDLVAGATVPGGAVTGDRTSGWRDGSVSV